MHANFLGLQGIDIYEINSTLLPIISQVQPLHFSCSVEKLRFPLSGGNERGKSKKLFKDILVDTTKIVLKNEFFGVLLRRLSFPN